jgi:hypothetical protein
LDNFLLLLVIAQEITKLRLGFMSLFFLKAE